MVIERAFALMHENFIVNLLNYKVMTEFRIIGEIKPNMVKLQNSTTKTVTQLPHSTILKMVEAGAIKVQNPEFIYPRI